MSFHKKLYFIIIITTFLVGILYYAWHQEWIIIRHPWWHKQEKIVTPMYKKKKIIIYTWYNNQWIQEQNDAIWSENNEAENIKHLTQASINLLFEEEIIKKKIHVDAVLNTADNTEFIIIFDRNPFSKQMSINEKHMIIESILKTLRANNIKNAKIRFLVNHQPLNDVHLDLLQSWPLEGFL